MKNGERSILIVEDESPIRALLMEVLGKRFHCQAADTAEAARHGKSAGRNPHFPGIPAWICSPR